jgi:3-hydroxyisobutyrate dehydrogenase-like beta-hydroxyacid dehydrogenase
VATHADVIFSSVSDDAALLDIVTGPDGLAAHLNARQIFVETSTVSPDISARVALLLRDSNVAYLRAPVSRKTGFKREEN